jgi:hypothetical protein
MPTAATSQWSAANRLDPIFDADEADLINVNLIASTTFAKGTVLGEVTASPGTYGPYASGASDGTQTPKVILQYACSTDGSKNVTLLGEFGVTRKEAPAYMNGTFKTAELTGMDANAVTKLGAALIQGDLTSGIIRI